MIVFGIAAGMLVIAGCNKKDNPVDTKLEAAATQDAAESIASGVGIDNGGALDQVGDVLDISTSASLQSESQTILLKYGGPQAASVQKTYDSITGWWTLTLDRQRGLASGYYYAEIHRAYQYQFLNSKGAFQKFWRVDNSNGTVDTAYTMNHKIITGTGRHQTRRLAQNLISLSGEWQAMGTNTGTVTINTVNNTPYTRHGIDTVKTLSATRTMDHTLKLTFTNVKGPRGSRFEVAQKTSGTITGHYEATVSFTRGELYKTRTVTRDFTITLGGGNGRAAIVVDNTTYTADIQTGELID